MMRSSARAACDTAFATLSVPVPLGIYAVRVELADVITVEELRHDLDANPSHWLLEFRPRLAEAASGRVTLDLTIAGPDVWTTLLTTMAVLRQAGYDMHALQVVPQEDHDQQSAA